ncbi:hypothetical protein KUTeg_010430 [Tegillarca granosa]|uniref:Uncharacterized protein n=1 Tax=Tegillarca granosa TaxID=220873 RepID=A0ABQ9F6S7_TEGGR|nr:hypothetical protein KUTeg_010430 [Tegillarca granosa]
MAAPGNIKLENTEDDDYFQNLINDDDDDLLYAASRNYESNVATNIQGEEELQTETNNKTTCGCTDIKKATNIVTNPDKITIDCTKINKNITEDSRANSDVICDENDSDKVPFYTCTPLSIYRPKYLCVTDLTQQDWCEQQLFYKFTMPMMITVPVDEQPVVAKGANIHTERELEVHDVISIKTTSAADKWGIKFLNLLTSVLGFLNGITVAREIPILGVPFNEDVMVFGIIDELRFDPDTYTIDLSELKTKLSRTTSTKAQQRQHSLQVMMYKKLFDDAVKGRLSKDHIQKHLNLDLRSRIW